MRIRNSLTCSTALVTLVLATTAKADVTPEQVWEELKSYGNSNGYIVTAIEAMSGDSLSLRDIKMALPLPEEGLTISIQAPEMTLAANGGAVDFAWPAQMPLAFSIRSDDENEGVTNGTLIYETVGPSLTVSGDPGDIEWTYSLPVTKLSLGELRVQGETIPSDVARGSVELSGFSGTTKVRSSDTRDVTQVAIIDGLTYDITARDPENSENTMLLTGQIDAIGYSAESKLPLVVDVEDPAALLATMEVDANVSYGGGSTQFKFVDSGEAADFASTSNGGTLTVRMNPESWFFDANATQLDIQFSGGDVPFPVHLKASEIGGNFAMPIARTEQPVDVAAGIKLADLEVNDLVWDIVDPDSKLPHDPATIGFDLTGKMRMLFDLYDPEQQEALADAPMPAELHALDIKSFIIDAVGAKLTGSGAFNFDNTDLETIPGMARPEGKLNAQLTGANALLGKLVDLGVLPSEQAMGARMMMAMFAVPAGDDTLNSTIEINEKGHVLANGQRVQ